MTIIGIDIGNYSTKIFKIKNGVPEIILTNTADRLFPTLINIYNNNDTIIRKLADENIGMSLKFYKNKICNLSQLMITNKCDYIYDYFTENIWLTNYLNKTSILTHIFVIYLNYIKTIINETNLEIVLVFPSINNIINLKNIHDAFKIVDMKLLSIISPTIATGIDYSFPYLVKKKFNNMTDNYIFIDLGYYSTKISLLQFNKNIFTEIKTDDKINIGCYYFDCYLLNIIINNFKIKFNIDLNDHIKQKLQLFLLCEKVRKDFSMNSFSVINTELYINSIEYIYNFKIDYVLYTSIIKDITDRLKNKIIDFTKNYKIKHIIVTGGFYRTPLIKKMLKDCFEHDIQTVLNLEESAARGACIYGALLSNNIRNNLKIDFKLQLNYDIYIKYNKYKPILLINKNNSYPIIKQLTIKKIENLYIEYSLDNKKYILLYNFKIPSLNELLNEKISNIDNIKIKFKFNTNKKLEIINIKLNYYTEKKLKTYYIPLENHPLQSYLKEIKDFEQKELDNKIRLLNINDIKNNIESKYYVLKNMIDTNKDILYLSINEQLLFKKTINNLLKKIEYNDSINNLNNILKNVITQEDLINNRIKIHLDRVSTITEWNNKMIYFKDKISKDKIIKNELWLESLISKQNSIKLYEKPIITKKMILNKLEELSKIIEPS